MPTASQLLGPDGPLSRTHAGYEEREGQLAMATAVERALRDERILICEAGTGTGKTLAYLLPAVLSGKTVVVSTATKALQEQIFTKDLPLVRKLVQAEVPAMLVKGLSNYLCKRRLHEFRTSPEGLLAEHARPLSIIEKWESSSTSGDVAELSGLGENHPLWPQVNSSSDTRIGSNCKYFEECFVTRMKRKAEKARLLIVNHHLFFADLALKGPHRGGALPPYDAVIFDEAHQLEDIATSFFGVRVSSSRIEAIVRDAERAFFEAKLMDRTRKGEGATLGLLVREATTRLFALLAQHQSGTESRQILARDVWSGDLLAAYHKLDSTLEALAAYAQSKATNEALEVVVRRAEEVRADLATIVDGATNRVNWVEVRARSASIGASPISLGAVLKPKLFENIPSVVLTSATLSTQQSFSFLRSRIGLAGDDLPLDELMVPSPFDYAERAMFYVPRDLPEPTDPSFAHEAAVRIEELLRTTGGGAFILCTSHRTMHAFHRHLQGRVPFPLFVQGERPKGEILNRFREAHDGVLVATMTFWEGVDVPGDALRLVILDKIPFAVPTDPVVMARTAALEEAGKNPFISYHVPTAAITLKQGFGRLIRTRQDRGIVALLDRRVHTRSYGKALLQSLPPAARVTMMSEVEAFAARLSLRQSSAPSLG